MRSPSNKLFIWIVFLLILIFLGAISYVNKNSEDKRKQHVFNRKASESEDWIFKHVKKFDLTDTTEGDMAMEEDSSDKSINTDKDVIVRDEDSDSRLHAEEVVRKSIYMHKMENYVKPPHESCKRRLPACMIVGVAKSGTREIIDFMGLHPHIVIYYKERTYEMPYFSKAYDKGQDWFQSQMPCSYSN